MNLPSLYPIEAYYRSADPWTISSTYNYTDASGNSYDCSTLANSALMGSSTPS